MFGRKKKQKLKALKNEGGFFFLISILALAFLAQSNIRALWEIAWRVKAEPLILTLASLSVGAWFAHTFIRNHNNVLVHELKHAIVSGFAGNSWKELRVGRDTGHFQFSFSDSTRRMNAIIMLAHYFFPLFTLPVFLVSLVLFYGNYDFLVIPVGIAFGADLDLGWRDFSPHQTDLQGIIGGVLIAASFIILMNTVLLTTFLAWGFR